MPRMAATLLVVVMALATLAGMGTYLGSQVQQLSADLPTYQNTIRDKLRSLRRNANMPSAWDGALRTYDTVERERSEEHTSELQSPCNLVCRLLLEKKKQHMLEGSIPPAHLAM